jgi:hypothetical protein
MRARLPVAYRRAISCNPTWELGEMAFLAGSEVPFYGRQLRASRLDSWRREAELVWRRWDDLVSAPRENRQLAFAAYSAALDAEASAAARLASSYTSIAA